MPIGSSHHVQVVHDTYIALTATWTPPLPGLSRRFAFNSHSVLLLWLEALTCNCYGWKAKVPATCFLRVYCTSSAEELHRSRRVLAVDNTPTEMIFVLQESGSCAQNTPRVITSCSPRAPSGFCCLRAKGTHEGKEEET